MNRTYPELAAEAAEITTPPLRLQRLAKRPSLMLIVAANLATPPEALTRLGQRGDDAVKAAVAANPNTPTATLLALAELFPQAFASNPVVALLLLEDPGVFAKLSDDFAWRVIADPAAPRELLFALQGNDNERVRRAAPLHVTVSGEAGADWEAETQQAFAHVPFNLFSSSNFLVRDDISPFFSRNTPLTIPLWLLEAMATHDNEDVRSAVANYPACPITLLTRLAGDSSAQVRRTVGHHPHTPPALRRLLAYEGDEFARRAVLWHSDLAVDLLIQLADDPSDLVREGVARHPYVPMEQLLVLARDSSARVRAGVAYQARLPSALLDEFAQDDDESVRLWTARNPSTAQATLERLGGDASGWVREYAAENPTILTNLLERGSSAHLVLLPS